jgi:hypothetical protein
MKAIAEECFVSVGTAHRAVSQLKAGGLAQDTATAPLQAT